MKKLLLTLIMSIMSFASTLPTNSVVKVFISASSSNYLHPWQSPNIFNYMGSGAIIEGNKIITTAHLISDTNLIEIQKENDSKKYEATIKYISHQADLALLEVKDKSFFENTKPLSINQTVNPKDEITVLAYPFGRDTILTTKGFVSKVEYVNYIWSKKNLPAIQIDVTTNSTNSGGAVVDTKGNLVGIPMMKLKDSTNVAYIIPSVIINTFLEDVKDGKVDGFFTTSTLINYIENENMKKYYGLENGNGVLVTSLDFNEKNLKINDVILSINGKNIANNGTIETTLGKINFNFEFHIKQIGEKVKLKVLRDKQIIDVDYLIKNETSLINTEYSQEARYVIFGGLVFTPLTNNYLAEIKNEASTIDMLFFNQKQKEYNLTEPIIWMETIFSHKVNKGYSSGFYILESVNDIKVKNFKHLVEILDTTTSEYLVFSFLQNKKVILNTKEARENFKDIERIYGLKSDRQVY